MNQARNNKNDRFKRVNKDMMYAENSSMYAVVKGAKGNCRFEVETLKGEIKYATLCGTVKKGGKIATDDFVLIEPIGANLYQIIYKYNKGQKTQLEKEGCLNKVVDPIKKVEKEKEKPEYIPDNIIFGADKKEDDNMDLINDLFIENIMKRKK